MKLWTMLQSTFAGVVVKSTSIYYSVTVYKNPTPVFKILKLMEKKYQIIEGQDWVAFMSQPY